jgi:MerR family transcriptional regulator, mercuric resistance operon regulatory protein
MKTRDNVRSATELPIGAVAQAARVNVETIRYYQRRGLVEEPNKPLDGQRRYSLSAVKRVVFIKRAQQLGFTLEEVKALLRLEDGQNCRETRALAEHKLALIEERIADLNRMRRLLKALIGECSAGKRPRSCPIIATLIRPSSETKDDSIEPGLHYRVNGGTEARARFPKRRQSK